LFIDVRMARHSGIGTYIRNVVGRIASGPASERITLLGDAQREPAFAGLASRPFDAGIYSVREQFLPLRMGVAKTDCYWCPHYNMPGLLRARQVVTVHDTCHLAMPQFTGGIVKRAYATLLFRTVSVRAKRIICDSQATADELVRLTGADSRKLEVIHLGVDEFWFGGTDSVRPVNAPYFLFVGNVKPHKNLRRLLAAFRLLRADLPSHRLIIVGKKDGFITGDQEVFREAQSLGDAVSFTGFVSDEELRAYLQHAEALAFPSLYEGFGLPILEAMAAGCPVVASNLKVHREIAGDLPVYCDPYSEEAIAAALREAVAFTAPQRATLVEAGDAHAKTFNWDRCARETMNVLEGVLNS
jgi:glycosyltransferase involved in cell wall biosynthesis